jgi:hypothetical protein
VCEVGENGLSAFPACTVAETTELPVSGPQHYLAFWRLLPGDAAGTEPVWEHIRRAAAPNPAYIYVPAFSLVRPVVQRLGVRVTEVQPAVELTPGGPIALGRRPALVEAGPEDSVLPGVTALPGTGSSPDLAPVPAAGLKEGIASSSGLADVSPIGAPDFDSVSPILIGRREASGLAHFVFLAIEVREAHDLQAAEIDLQPGRQELVFFPAVWDPRYIHESNWRLLLREFDGLVA